MKTLVCQLQGRFGNQVMIYLFARGFAEAHGMELQCDEWIGERIFDIPVRRPVPNPARERYNEIQLIDLVDLNLLHENSDVEFRGYAQMQRCVDYYTKRQAQGWLRLRRGIEDACIANQPHGHNIVCHLRHGDYIGYNYPLISLKSYRDALTHYGLNADRAIYLSEEEPLPHDGLSNDLSFMPDFYAMMTAPTLLRANSTFSWVAGLLGNGIVLSPVVDGLEGGKEHDCRFVCGNYPRFTNLDFVEDLHCAP